MDHAPAPGNEHRDECLRVVLRDFASRGPLTPAVIALAAVSYYPTTWRDATAASIRASLKRIGAVRYRNGRYSAPKG